MIKTAKSPNWPRCGNYSKVWQTGPTVYIINHYITHMWGILTGLTQNSEWNMCVTFQQVSPSGPTVYFINDILSVHSGLEAKIKTSKLEEGLAIELKFNLAVVFDKNS